MGPMPRMEHSHEEEKFPFPGSIAGGTTNIRLGGGIFPGSGDILLPKRGWFFNITFRTD